MLESRSDMRKKYIKLGLKHDLSYGTTQKKNMKVIFRKISLCPSHPFPLYEFTHNLLKFHFIYLFFDNFMHVHNLIISTPFFSLPQLLYAYALSPTSAAVKHLGVGLSIGVGSTMLVFFFFF